MIDYWREHDSWPFDAARQVLLLRAVGLIGSAMRGDVWKEDVGSQQAVIRAVRQWGASEQLIASWRGPGGVLSRIDPSNWSSPYSSSWVTTGKLSNADAYGHGGPYNRSKNPRHWIFVEKEKLANLIAGEQALRKAKSGPVANSKTAPDRTPKKALPLRQVRAWAQPIFDRAVEEGRPSITQDKFEKEARGKWPNISIAALRKLVWDKRPSVFPRKAPRNSG